MSEIHEDVEMNEPEPRKFLTFDQIHAAKDITEKVVDISEWDGSVLVRSISKRQMDAILKASVDPKTGESDSATLEKMVICTGLVEPSLTAEQYDELKDKTASAWMKIYKAISDSSNMRDIARQVEEERFPQ